MGRDKKSFLHCLLIPLPNHHVIFSLSWQALTTNIVFLNGNQIAKPYKHIVVSYNKFGKGNMYKFSKAG